MGKRYVDADILDDLSRHARRTRDDLADLLHKCEGRVKILPQRGWNLGTWGDVFNSVKHEATSLDDHARELVDRAAKVREAARERVLQELRELWAAIAGLREKIEAEANWLKKFWEKWHPPWGKWPYPWPKPPWPKPPWPWPLPPWLFPEPKPPWHTWPWPIWPWPTLPIPVPPLPLPPWWPSPKPEPQPQPMPPGPVPQPPVPPEPPAPPPARGALVAEAARRYEGKAVDVDGFPPDDPIQCVDLVKAVVRDLGGGPLNFAGGGPLSEWGAVGNGQRNHIFWNSQLWQKIEAGQIMDQGGYQPGDIIFFSGNGWASNGHIGIVVDCKGGVLTVLEQNHYESGGPVKSVKQYTYPIGNQTIDGVVRYRGG